MTIPRWTSIDVTSSRRPILDPDEEVLYVQSHVGLYNGKHKASNYQDGVVYLTGSRICYVDSAQPAIRSIALDLVHIDKLEHYTGFLKSSPKLSIRFRQEHNSSAGTSGISTPQEPSLAAPKHKPTRDWICAICTFTNVIPPALVDPISLPPCKNCGMKPGKNVKISDHIAQASSLITKLQTSTLASQSQSPVETDVEATFSKTDPIHKLSKKSKNFLCPRCTFANHPAITTCELCGAPLISGNLPPMLNSNTNTDERNLGSTKYTAGTIQVDNASCKLSFRAGGDKAFLEKTRRALANQAWVPEISNTLAKEQMTITTVKGARGAGISALQSREEQLRSQDAIAISAAFEDLGGLMARAKEMIALAESLAEKAATASNTAQTVKAQTIIAETSAMRGLTSPIVTKDSVGRTTEYHAELARQLVEFLESGALRQEGGVITLADMYASYNRARKGSLIAPDDLYNACQQFDKLRLPVVLRHFRSGILVVQDRSRNDASTRRLVLNWLRDRTIGVSAIEAAERFGWSIGVAKEELEMIEDYGDIVRDSGIQGLRFYENLILQWDWQSWLDKELGM